MRAFLAFAFAILIGLAVDIGQHGQAQASSAQPALGTAHISSGTTARLQPVIGHFDRGHRCFRDHLFCSNRFGFGPDYRICMARSGCFIGSGSFGDVHVRRRGGRSCAALRRQCSRSYPFDVFRYRECLRYYNCVF